MLIIKRLLLLACLLLAPTAALAQTNPLGNGYSLANGQLFVQVSPSLNSLLPPFSYSFNVTVPTVSGSVENFIASNPTGTTTGGLNTQYSTQGDSYRLRTYFQPGASAGGFPQCTHNSQMCWRGTAINDGNRHNVCVRWTPIAGYFYLDGVLRDQTTAIGPYANSSELFWTIGGGAPSTWTFFDTRVYSSDIGANGCTDLANFAANGTYPTTGYLATTPMVLHLPLDNCVIVGAAASCNDTSGNANNASNGSGAPVISIATPVAGTVSGTTSATVSCTISSGTCSQVCYYIDGFLLSSTCPSTTSPTYAYSWDTTKAVDGSHVLTAVGYSVAGLTTTSAPVTVTVNNSLPAITYNFNSSTGSDSNNCTSSACQTIAKLQTLNLRGGDIVNLVGTGFSSGTSLILCGPGASAKCGTQNFFPSSSTLTIAGPGACTPLSGSSTVVPTNCATITRTGGGLTDGIVLWNISNAIVKNIALVGTSATAGNQPTVGMAVETTTIAQFGQSSNVTFENNYIFNWDYGVTSNIVLGFASGPQANNGPVTNFQVLDNYITSTFGASSSPDAGVTIFGNSQALVQGNLQENAGGHSDDQGNGLAIQNWPNPGGSTTPTIFQFNVTHNNGGNFLGGSGGPYSLYSIGGDNAIFQFNEEYLQQCWTTTPANCPGAVDNGGADIDTGSTHILMQYNYIHDNIMVESNAMLFFIGSRSGCCGGNPGWGDNYYRFNIAENYYVGVQGNNLNGNPTIGSFGAYNNTMSSNQGNVGVSNALFQGSCLYLSGGFNTGNNICINTAPSPLHQYYVSMNGGCFVGDYNDYFTTTGQNNWVVNFATYTSFTTYQTNCIAQSVHKDVHSLNVNPLLAGATGATGPCWPGGTTIPGGPQNAPSAGCPANYQLTNTSPLIGAGILVTPSSSVYSPATQDYYGKSLPYPGGSGYPIGASAGP